MSFATAMIRVLGAAALALAVASHVDADTADDLRERISALERQIAALEEAQDSAKWNMVRAREIRTIVADVLADADQRASLLGGAAAGWDDGFFFRANDGAFRLNIGGRIQTRYVLNLQEGENTDKTRSGFEVRRARLELDGHVGDPRWTYAIAAQFNRSGGGFEVLNAEIHYEFADGLTVTAGKFKPPFLREALHSSARLLAVERSLVHEALTQGRSEGVQVDAEFDRVHLAASINDGFDTGSSPALAEDTEFAITGRAEMLITGSWRAVRDYTSKPDGETAFVIGGAAHYQKSEFGTSGPGNDDEADIFAWSVDAVYEQSGFNVYGAVVGRHIDPRVSEERDLFGAVIQAGWRPVDEWEIFARYEWGDDDTSADDLSVLTAGVIRYFHDHAFKWTTDIGYGFDGVSDTWASSGAGWRADGPGERGQIVIRSQLQLLF